MALSITSIRLDKRLADEAAEVLGVKSRTEAVHAALREIVALKRFKKKIQKAGILSEIKRRERYEKPSVKRKRKAEAARKRRS